MKLLIADDDKEMRSWLRLVFRSLEVDFFEARDGVELLAVLRQEGPFDLVITDVRMPGKSGLEAVAEARQAGFTVGVILLTGYASDLPADRVERLGNVVLLAKPVESHDLLARGLEIIMCSDRRRLPHPS